MMHLPYAEQLRRKEASVRALLGKYGKVSPIIGMDEPYHYRNKVQAAFKHLPDGRVISGVYQSGSHRVVSVDDCLLEDRTADRIIVTIRSMLRSFKIPVFDEDTGRGVLRHVLVKRGFHSGEVMVVLVCSTPTFPSRNNFLKALLEKHPEITTVILNINPFRTNLVLGPSERVLYGKGTIEDTLCGKVFRISAKSFYQINPVQTEVLYGKAVEFAHLHGKETVIDAYCGIGTIGLVAADKAGKVIGVELNKDAVHDAIANCKRNGVKNARFYCGDAGEFMRDMADAGEKADVVFMDPPRAGSSREFLLSAVKLAPQRIVYISCNPETQARDIALLHKNGYRVQAIQPVDMFPHTAHVETVVQLVRKKPDTYIDITVDMDELDLTSSEAKATYDEIKDYIFDKHCIKVSSLYVAQVKQKHGIIERDCYNNPKKDNPKQPQCPPEKVKLIEEALRHFKMIP